MSLFVCDTAGFPAGECRGGPKGWRERDGFASLAMTGVSTSSRGSASDRSDLVPGMPECGRRALQDEANKRRDPFRGRRGYTVC